MTASSPFPQSPYIFHKRLRWIYGVFIIIALVLIYKLASLQLIHGNYYYNEAIDNYIVKTDTFLERGNIYFEDKEGNHISAATVQTGYRVLINPTKVLDPEKLFSSLTPYLSLEHDYFISQATKVDDKREVIAERVDDKIGEKLRDANLIKDVVILERDQWRYYPALNHGAHAIGFLAYDDTGTHLEGRYGLEKFYDKVLTHENDGLYVNFFAQIFSDIGDTLASPTERDGDIITTIEPQVQAFLDDTLSEAVERWKADYGGAIIMDSKTGALRAMSVYPSFDLNNFKNVENNNVFNNPLVGSVFEMGSIIKPLIMSMAFDHGVVTPSTKYTDLGSVVVADRTINNFDHKARGTVNMEEVLKQSLNTGMVFVMQKMDKKKVKDKIYELGFGEKTGIDLPSETSGLLKNLDSLRDVEYANVSFGQGMAVTPIATVRALGVIANHGILTNPHLAKEIDYKDGFSKNIEPELEQKRIFSESTIEDITTILVKLADTSFKGNYPQLDKYSIAAKTGTAQVANQSGGGYYDDRNLHSFFGFFPAYEPRYVVFFYLMYPKGVRYSSETLSGPFMDTAQFIINYYDISPDRMIVQ